MNWHICVRAFALPSTYPKGPADRLIAATALVQGLSLVTAIGYGRPRNPSIACRSQNLVRAGKFSSAPSDLESLKALIFLFPRKSV
jgi:hypothetical protein